MKHSLQLASLFFSSFLRYISEQNAFCFPNSVDKMNKKEKHGIRFKTFNLNLFYKLVEVVQQSIVFYVYTLLNLHWNQEVHPFDFV